MILKSNSPGKTEKTFSLSTSLCLGISLEGIIKTKKFSQNGKLDPSIKNISKYLHFLLETIVL